MQTKKNPRTLSAFLAANPALEVVAHPNPAGLGPRRFLRQSKGEYLFDRPGLGVSSMPVAADFEMTADGFTVLGGRIVYRRTHAP